MPIINFYNNNSGITCNKGSCRELLEYLLYKNDDNYIKNNMIVTDFQYKLFDAQNEVVNIEDAIQTIDGNTYGLHKKDAKYYPVDLNFSQGEIEAILKGCKTDLDMENNIKDFIRSQFVPIYAANFIDYKDKDGKQIKFTADDIVWVAIVYPCRFTRRKVPKEKSWYAQIVFSRLNKDRTRSLSPSRSHKKAHEGQCQGAFNRNDFRKKIEKAINKQFSYNRPLLDSLYWRVEIAHTQTEKIIEQAESAIKRAEKLINLSKILKETKESEVREFDEKNECK